MYRILRSVDEVHERRRQAVHPAYVKPELVADRPNRVWSWDITKLLGPAKWTYYFLYVILDIYSRYVPGWMVATCESATLAERLLAESIIKQGIDRDQLTIHADRGSSMASKPVALLLADLGVTKSYSRPHCSNDNPYSEAQFKTFEVPPGLPRALRVRAGRARLLPAVLRLVQRRAPALGHWLPHANRRPPRPRPRRPRPTRRGADLCLCHPSRALRPQGPGATAAAGGRLDQPTGRGGDVRSVISTLRVSQRGLTTSAPGGRLSSACARRAHKVRSRPCVFASSRGIRST